jgi:energy-coupling factor transport system substrate-specific component
MYYQAVNSYMPASRSKLSVRLALFLLPVGGLAALAVWQYRTLFSRNWGLGATIVMVIAMAFLFLGFERSNASVREIGVIAVLATVAAVSGVPAFIPGVQPTTFLVIVSGFVFGPEAGSMVGATAALIANFFRGQGPWTPVQMLAWGAVGVSSGFLGLFSARIGRTGMLLFSLAWGYLFGWLVDLWFWTCFVQPLSWQTFLATYAASFLFDTLHAAGNATFYLICGPQVIKVLRRFQKKLTFTVNPD